MKKVLLIILISISNLLIAQDTICKDKTIEHKIHSEFLDEDRSYWINLPYKYSDSLSYSIIYVFDAEWRFNLIKNIIFD